MKYLFIPLLLILISCGPQKIEIESPESFPEVQIDDSEHTVSGETYSYVILQLEFIQQIKTLCEELNLLSDFDTIELYKQEVSRCTFENLAVLDLGAIDSFTNAVCVDPQTVEEIDVCTALVGSPI